MSRAARFLRRTSSRTLRVPRTALAALVHARALPRTGGRDTPGGFALLAFLVLVAAWEAWF
jgi:hypothetical protein